MAIERIDEDKLFQPKITKKLIKDLDDLIKKGDQTTESLIKIRDVLREIDEIKNAEQFKLFTEQTAKLNKVQAELVKLEEKRVKLNEKILTAALKRQKADKEQTKTQKEKIKLTKQLTKANSDEIQEVVELKVQLQEQNKVNKELAKDSLGLVDAYEKESKELNDLRKKYKSLAVQNKENTEEGRALLANITRLDKKLKDVDDTVGQNQRSVGKYSKALEGLNATLGKLGIIALIAKSLEFLGSVFSDNREGVLALEIAFSKFTETAKVFINSFVASFSGVKDLFSAVGDSIVLVGKKIERTFLEIQKVTPFAADVTQELTDINNEIKELEKSSVSDAIDKITEAFKGNIETTSRAIEEQEKFLELQLKTKISIEQQEKALAGLAEQRQILQDISDDDTIGFITRAQAVEKAQKVAIEFAQLENRLALTKEKLTIDAVKQDLRRAKALDESQLAQINTGEQLRLVLQDVAIARKVSDSNDEAFTAAFVERRDKEVEAQSFARDAEEKFRKTARDAFEQELDILEEFTEKRIASNEKIISSDSSSIEQRQKALRENQKLESELLEASIDLILKQGAASIDLREDLTDAEKEFEKALILSADIQEIINEQDAQEIFNLIRRLDLGEIEEKRLKETLKIKQDINESNVESLKIVKDAVQAELQASDELFNSIEGTRREGFIAAEQDREKNRKLRETDLILQAEFESIQFKEMSDERILIAEKLKNDLAAIERERVADVEAANKKIAEDDERLKQERIDNAVEFANSVFDSLQSQLQRQNELFNEALNNEITALQESIDRQLESNREGGEQKLADDQALLAKRELERKRALEAQAKQERLIALSQQFVNSAAAHAKDDPEGAIVKALAEVFAAEGIAKLIAGFEKGGLVEGGEQIIKINEKGQEFVVDAKTTKSLGLDKPGSKMADFHKRFNHNINIPEHLFRNIDLGGMTPGFDSSSINKGQNEAAEKIANTIKSEAINYEMFLDGVATVVTKLSKGGRTEKIIYERDSDTF